MGLRVFNVMGGEVEGVWLGDSAIADDRVLCLGREAGNSNIFLFRLAFFKIGTVAEITTALAEALVLLLFGGVSIFLCIFRLSKVIGMLSSESSVEIPSMGMEGLVLLGDGIVSAGISTADCSFSATCGGVCWRTSLDICSGMSSAC